MNVRNYTNYARTPCRVYQFAAFLFWLLRHRSPLLPKHKTGVLTPDELRWVASARPRTPRLDSAITSFLLNGPLASPTPVFPPNRTFQLGSLTGNQMAMAITGGYRGRIPLPNAVNETDGVYVAANYHYLHGFRYDRFDLATRLDTAAAGLLTVRPGTTPVSIDRLKSSTGNGFALDVGTAVALDEWTFGFGASGLANRIEWDAIERERFVLQSLSAAANLWRPTCRHLSRNSGSSCR